MLSRSNSGVFSSSSGFSSTFSLGQNSAFGSSGFAASASQQKKPDMSAFDNLLPSSNQQKPSMNRMNKTSSQPVGGSFGMQPQIIMANQGMMVVQE